MKTIFKVMAFVLCIGAAVFYCSISNAHTTKHMFDIPALIRGFVLIYDEPAPPVTRTCQNQALNDFDDCDVYVITD